MAHARPTPWQWGLPSLMDLATKALQTLLVLALFAGVVVLQLLLARRVASGRRDSVVAAIFLAPAVVGILVIIVYPAIRTVVLSFFDSEGTKYVGLDNYSRIIESPDELTIMRNTAIWVIGSPLLATSIGMVYAVLVDRRRHEALAKALVFLPMAISFVGASIIWKFIYEYRPDQPGVEQIGLLNQIVVWVGGTPQQWLLLDPPFNTFFLLAVMVWIQAGFAMTVLSAAIKGIPMDIIEAARTDGADGRQVFRYITLPGIRASSIVAMTTLAIWTLKVFDIVRTMTGGNFDTSVLANEYYTQAFRVGDQGFSAALATLLLVLVLPIMVLSTRAVRRAGSLSA